MAGVVGQGGVQYTFDFGLLGNPLGELDTGFVVLLQAQGHGAQAAGGEVAVVGRSRLAKVIGDRLECRPGFFGTGDRTHDHIGVADDIFGGGLDRDIDAVLEGFEVERRAPGVVHHDDGLVLVCDFGNRGNVLHFKRERAGGFDEHQAGVGAHQGGDACTD